MTAETATNDIEPNGGSGASDQSDAQSDAAGATGAAGEAASSEAPAAPEIPKAYRAEDGSADLNKLIERVNAADAAPEGVPDSVEGYDLALAEEVELPGGQKVQIDPENEQTKALLAEFHKAGVPQSVLTSALTTYSKSLAADMGAFVEAQQGAVDAEIAKLGDNADARVTGLVTGLTEILGSEAQAKAVAGEIRSYESFEAFEALVAKQNGAEESSRTPGGVGSGSEKTLAQRMYPTS